MIKRLGFSSVFLFVVATSAFACLWDYDTLAMERQQFPSVLELITGKFLRHSPEFYKWRVADREARIASQPDDPALYDDLAVAYDKLGEHQKAIDLMRVKEDRFPGLYETQANLGTFIIHSGELEKGLPYIDKAIEINPDAHFGREIYQKRLVEYVLAKRKSKDASTGPKNFADFLFGTRRTEEMIPYAEMGAAKNKAELSNAIKGIVGIMRFGNHESPIVLEALGDLLQSAGFPENANRLAARAYLKASYGAKDSDSQKRFREKAERALTTQMNGPRVSTSVSLDELEHLLRNELEQADAWHASVVSDEQQWITEGENVDHKFSTKYYREPLVSSLGVHTPLSPVFDSPAFPVCVIIVSGMSLLLFLRLQRR